jgi:Undecaprenyl-phosphate galactose phosphotransferase WbaP
MSATSALTLSPAERRTTGLLSERLTGATFIIADILAVLAAFAFTIALRDAIGGASLWLQFLRLTPFLAVIPVLIALMDLYPGVLLNPVEEFRRLTIAIAVGMSLVVVVTFLFKVSAQYSRLLFMMAIPLGVSLALAGRWLVRKVFSESDWWGVPTILVGPVSEVEQMRLAVESQPWIGIRAAAVAEAELDYVPNDAGSLAQEDRIPYALVILPSGADRDWIRRTERLVWHCKKIIVVPQSMGVMWSWMRIRDCCGVIGLEVRRELLRRRARMLKRALDWTLALIGAVFVAPLVIAIGALVKLNSRGPVFYRHLRIGEGARTFRAWKFRTMVDNADEVLQRCLRENAELREEWEADRKLRNDPRVTTIGRFLRRTSFDELPQIWNVIRGEMSFVGPRPIVHEEVEKYGEEFDLYQKVRPGITGLWQVSGRNDITYRKRVAMDVHYVRNWSVWLDVYLLAKTVGVVLRRQGAY